MLGIKIDNLQWMFSEASKKGGTSSFNGYLLLDEMPIQQDLQIVKRGYKWTLVGSLDLGPTVNSLDEITRVVLYIPTTFVFDKEVQEFKIFFSRNTGQYWITFHGTELDSDYLGIGHYSSFDQIFVHSVSRICNAFILCQGKQVHLPDGKHASKNTYQALIGRLGANNQIENARCTLYSTNCHRVLPLTCELSNRTCHSCVHDINQRIRQLGNTGFLDSETVAGLIKHRKGDVLEEFLDDGDTEQEKSVESLTPNILKCKLDDVDKDTSVHKDEHDTSKSGTSGHSSKDQPTGPESPNDDDDDDSAPWKKGEAVRRQGVCIIYLLFMLTNLI